MTRRNGPPLNSAQYCGDTASKEVHDLDRERISCLIGVILIDQHAVPFESLDIAHERGYKNCPFCLGPRIWDAFDKATDSRQQSQLP